MPIGVMSKLSIHTVYILPGGNGRPEKYTLIDTEDSESAATVAEKFHKDMELVLFSHRQKSG